MRLDRARLRIFRRPPLRPCPLFSYLYEGTGPPRATSRRSTVDPCERPRYRFLNVERPTEMIMKLCGSNLRPTEIFATTILRDACCRAGLPLAAVLLVAFLPVISANAQSASQSGTSQDSSQAAAQSTSAPSDSTTPAMQNASAPPQQSLGDAARAANAQKEKTKAKHVYTDDDVSSIGGTISVVGDGHSSGSSADEDANANAQGAGASAGAQDEKYWRDRANQIKNA